MLIALPWQSTMWTLSILLKLQYGLCPSCRLLKSFLPSPHFLPLFFLPPSWLLKCIYQVSAYFASPCPSVFPKCIPQVYSSSVFLKCILQVYFSSAFPNSLFRSPPFPGGGREAGGKAVAMHCVCCWRRLLTPAETLLPAQNSVIVFRVWLYECLLLTMFVHTLQNPEDAQKLKCTVSAWNRREDCSRDRGLVLLSSILLEVLRNVFLNSLLESL